MIAPLDWGLGHATRCIPVIRFLLGKGHTVVVAASGPTATLLNSNFPELDILPLPGYEITYSRSGRTFTARILAQVPKILGAIRRERRWLAREHARQPFDLVISDNRYGLKIPGVRSVIMTHQLQIRTGFGQVSDLFMRKLHYRLLEKFDECWVVDYADTGLGGTLSHPDRLPANARYIGVLSQLQRPPARPSGQEQEILALLSGPEPMRGMFEELLIAQATRISERQFRIVAGHPAGRVPSGLPRHIAYHTYLNAAQLADALDKAQLVICRSGYSTLMDLAAFGKKALLIPTPGQSEQEYLAAHLQARGLFLTRRQDALDLELDLPASSSYRGFATPDHDDPLKLVKAAVEEIFEKLRK
nr:glycosyltransferase [uncultured Dyadobacter sp.]